MASISCVYYGMGHRGNWAISWAGVFMPVALGWLIGGYYLQLKELEAQREELVRTRDALEKQVKIEEERIENERLREMFGRA